MSEAEPAVAATPTTEPQPAPVLEPTDSNANTSAGMQMVELGGEDSLSIAAADAVAARWGASVTLIAGEDNAGKTTLLAELYAQFLKGPCAGWSFAGSNCLIALDRRYDGARGAGPGPPKIDHTVDEEMRLIDLRLWGPGGRRVSLLLSDIKGELVRQVIEGAPASEELPLAVRADRTAVVIDGEEIADLYGREEAVTRARALIGALTDPGGVPRGRPLAVLLTKRDKLDEEARDWFRLRAEQLGTFAEERGARATTLITAARPDGAPHLPEGLEDLLAWLVADERAAEKQFGSAVACEPERSFWAMREGTAR